MTTPRETIAAFMHEMQHGEPKPYLTPDENADELLRLLKANGLFVGPIRSTSQMGEICQKDHLTSPPLAAEIWETMVERWQQGEGR